MLPVGSRPRAVRDLHCRRRASQHPFRWSCEQATAPTTTRRMSCWALEVLPLPAGENQTVVADFDVTIEEARYLFYCLLRNEHVAVRSSEQRVSGVLSVAQKDNPARVQPRRAGSPGRHRRRGLRVLVPAAPARRTEPRSDDRAAAGPVRARERGQRRRTPDQSARTRGSRPRRPRSNP